ncbi:hypothetical protein S83_005820, partial [Arachis hypogaea]
PEIRYTFLLWNCPSFKLRDQTPQVPKFVLFSDWLGCISLKASSILHGLQSFRLLKEAFIILLVFYAAIHMLILRIHSDRKPIETEASKPLPKHFKKTCCASSVS